MKFLNNLLHNCEETSLNVVKSGDTSLLFSARLKMKFHLAFCKCCRNFKKQTLVIDKVLQTHFHSDISYESMKASQELKNKIKQNFKKM